MARELNPDAAIERAMANAERSKEAAQFSGDWPPNERKEKMSEAFAQADDNLVKTFQFLKKRNDEVFYVQSHNLQKMFIRCQERLKEIEKDWFAAHDKQDNQ